MSMGGGKGGGKTSTAESRLSGGIGSRFEQEARSSRTGALGNLEGILDFGADWLGPSMGGPSNYPGSEFDRLSDPANRRFTRAEILNAYTKNDPGKGQDLERIMAGLPGDSYTLDELRGGANLGGLSFRSGGAWNSTLGELGSVSRSGGAGMGGVNKGPGGYGAALLPIAQQSVEASLQATSNAAKGLTAQAASVRGGGAANPYFQQQIARTRMLGDQATSQVPSRITEQFVQSLYPLAFGQSGPAVGAVGNGAGIGANLYGQSIGGGAAGGAANQQAMGAIGSAIAAGLMGSMGGGANFSGVSGGGSSTAPVLSSWSTT